jgi:cytochrome c551/c552
MKTIVTVSILSAAALLIAGMLTFAPTAAEANQAMAQKTGKGCPTCHTAPPALNATGKKYKETGKL